MIFALLLVGSYSSEVYQQRSFENMEVEKGHFPIKIPIGGEASLEDACEPRNIGLGRCLISQFMAAWEDACLRGAPPQGVFIKSATFTNLYGHTDLVAIRYCRPGDGEATPEELEMDGGLNDGNALGVSTLILATFLAQLHGQSYAEAAKAVTESSAKSRESITSVPIRRQREWVHNYGLSIPRHL